MREENLPIQLKVSCLSHEVCHCICIIMDTIYQISGNLLHGILNDIREFCAFHTTFLNPQVFVENKHDYFEHPKITVIEETSNCTKPWTNASKSIGKAKWYVLQWSLWISLNSINYMETFFEVEHENTPIDFSHKAVFLFHCTEFSILFWKLINIMRHDRWLILCWFFLSHD